MPLTKEQILGAADLTRETVEVPEWGGSVEIRVMTAAERVAFERKATEKPEGVVTLAVASTVCDEAGSLLFTEADIDALGGKNPQVLVRIFKAAQKLNKITMSDVDAAEGESAATRSNT